jgi:hypothetical protein
MTKVSDLGTPVQRFVRENGWRRRASGVVGECQSDAG